MRLLVIQGPEKGACFSVLGDTIFIGREGCQISLNDSNVSKRHAEVSWATDHYEVRDLGSSNGILINGEKLPASPLKPGDLLLIGLTILEVYPPGQVIRNERPLLPAGSRRAALPGPAAAIPAATPAPAAPKEEDKLKPKLSPEEDKKKRELEKKKMLIYVALFFAAFMLYFGSDESKTIRENAKIDPAEEETKKAPGKKMKKKELEEALSDYMPSYNLDTQQRKDAEIFFRNGVRELTNKNFRRSFTAFETALTVDPSHELAKIYLRTAKIEMINELKSMNNAAIQAQKSLRYREARQYYENIIRYLEGEDGGKDLSKYQDNEVIKMTKKGDKKELTIPEIYESAKNGIKDLDKAENKIE